MNDMRGKAHQQMSTGGPTLEPREMLYLPFYLHFNDYFLGARKKKHEGEALVVLSSFVSLYDPGWCVPHYMPQSTVIFRTPIILHVVATNTHISLPTRPSTMRVCCFVLRIR